MKILPALKTALILSIPLLIFLSVLGFAAFDSGFFYKKFQEYNVDMYVKNPNYLHKNTIDYIRGANTGLSSEFNDREAKHLADVRNLVNALSEALFLLSLLFIGIISYIAVKLNTSKFYDFFGKVLAFGGALTILLSAIMLVLINMDFQLFFEGFHKLFFEGGTYLFDPSSEIIVRLYPEQIFMDIGFRISKWVLLASASVTFIGAMLIFYSKRKIYNHR